MSQIPQQDVREAAQATEAGDLTVFDFTIDSRQKTPRCKN